MGPLRFMAAGNFSHIVSYPAWHHCVSPSQETFRIWFLIRHGTITFQPQPKTVRVWFLIRHSTIAFHLHRKLFAYGFLSGMAPLRFNLGRKLL